MTVADTGKTVTCVLVIAV